MSTISELALIIGGTSGMGKETAKLLVGQDIPVWVAGVNWDVDGGVMAGRNQ